MLKNNKKRISLRDAFMAGYRFTTSGGVVIPNKESLLRIIPLNESFAIDSSQKKFIDKIILYNKDILVVHNPDAVTANGFMIAMSSVANFSIGQRIVILVDDFYMNLPDDIKEFIIYHEIGHILNGDIFDIKFGLFLPKEKRHFVRIKRMFNSKESILMEEMADLYAADKVGTHTSIKAISLLNEEFKTGGKKEIKMRYENLKNISKILYSRIIAESENKTISEI